MSLPSFRLLTVNLWGVRSRPDALLRALETHAPDVVLAQELAPAQAEVLARALPHGIFAPRHDTNGMALASRWPVHCDRLALPGRDAQLVRLPAGTAAAISRELAIVNVHLSAPTRLGRLRLRRRQLTALRRHLGELSSAHVLAGDLNSFALMPAYRMLCRELTDAARVHARWPRATWGPGARGPRWLRLDHVLVRGLRTLALETIHVAGSDHRALLATLAFEPET